VRRIDPDKWLGVVLPGGYKLVEHIGGGGMGAVFRGEHEEIKRTVAVKVIYPDLLSDRVAVQRFIKEARAMSMLNHPNALAIVDYGHTDQGVPYMITEFLRGQDLRAILARTGPLVFERIIMILRQVLDALEEAHRLGIVHRDVKPENIVVEAMRTGGDFVKLVDFGIATFVDGKTNEPLTAAGTYVGTPAFLSPEQVKGDPIDGRADVYGVGVTLFFLLTGQYPFSASTNMAMLTKKIHQDPPDPRTVAPERQISEGLAAVTLRALERDPSKRFPTASAFASALVETRREVRMSVQVRRSFSSGVVWCRQCGDLNELGRKFCGECGAKLATSPEEQRPTGVGSLVPTRRGEFYQQAGRTTVPFLDRSEDVNAIFEYYDGARENVRAARIAGPPGVGKSAFARVFSDMVDRRGHLVAWVAPDPWHVGVSLFALRSAVRQLAALPAGSDVDPDALPGIDEQAKRGIRLTFAKPGEPTALEGDAWLRQCADMLRWACQFASARSSGRPALIVLDDFDMLDSASAMAFLAFLELTTEYPVWLMATHGSKGDQTWPPDVPIHELGSVGPTSAEKLAGPTAAGRWLVNAGEVQLRPLYLEHLQRLVRECSDTPPPLLSDLIALRVKQLGPRLQRLLQAVAILGMEATLDDVERISQLGDEARAVLSQLEAAGLLWSDGVVCGFVHSLVREVVLAGIPTAASEQMYAAALAVIDGERLPLEVRAHYATGAGNAFVALALWDEVGTAAMRCKDPIGAMRAYRHALSVARTEMVRGEVFEPVEAVMVFSRKLAEALMDLKQPGAAEGVLREAIELRDATPAERSRLLHAFSRVKAARGQPEEARTFLDQALRESLRAGDADWARHLRAELGNPPD
jgi:serine/threonine protein kinase/tetratricopeptide (TPR) repeat protein